MKRHLTLLLFCALSVRADIEFSAFFTTAKETRIALSDTGSGSSSGWLRIGQSFGGYTLLSFNPEQDVVVLRQGEQLLTLPLRGAKVKDSMATISGSLTFLNDKLDGVRASLFLGEEASFPLKNGITFRIKAERLADGTIHYNAKFITMGDDGAEKVLSAPSVVATPGQPFGIQVGAYGYSFSP